MSALERHLSRRTDVKASDRAKVRQALNLGEMIARGTIEPQPADVTTFVEARAAFARLNIEED